MNMIYGHKQVDLQHPQQSKTENPTTALLHRWGRPRPVTTPEFQTSKSKKRKNHQKADFFLHENQPHDSSTVGGPSPPDFTPHSNLVKFL